MWFISEISTETRAKEWLVHMICGKKAIKINIYWLQPKGEGFGFGVSDVDGEKLIKFIKKLRTESEEQGFIDIKGIRSEVLK